MIIGTKVPRLYVTWKDELFGILRKHFPDFIVSRFSIRSDSQMYKKDYDEGVWNRWKADNENMHVFFDGLEILEVPHIVTKQIAEYFLLKRFKEALERDEISLEREMIIVDNEVVKQIKKEKNQKKKKRFHDAVQYALQKLPDITKKQVSLPDGLSVNTYTLGGE